MPKPNPLDELLQAQDQDTTTEGKCPNKHPCIHGQQYRIAIIGEAPGVDEVRGGEPFVGYSGKLLTGLLSKAGIIRDACFIGNICQTRPAGNDITLFSRTGKEFTEGLNALAADLQKFKPNVCLLLGKTALWAAKGVDNIGDWRGSFFISDRQGPFYGLKCIAAYHPAACLRMYELKPLLMFDIIKMFRGAKSPTLSLPQRDLRIRLSINQIVDELERFNNEAQTLSIDIEGYVDAMTCVSVANSPSYSILIPFTNGGGTSYWSVDDEVRLWQSLSKVFANPNVPKIFQNGLYDRFVFQYSYNLIVRGNKDDTMLCWWELYCEMEKKLGVQTSIMTDEPYYKSERKSTDQDKKWIYCCKDSAVTYEIAVKVNKYLAASSQKHYSYNMDLLHPMLYMENHGLLYNSTLAAERLKEVNHWIYGLQFRLDTQATVDYCLDGQIFGLDWRKPRQELVMEARQIMGWKKNIFKPVKKFEDVYDEVIRVLVGQGPLTPENKGFISIACKQSMNIRTSKKKKKLDAKAGEEITVEIEVETDPNTQRNFKYYLYEKLALPKQYKTDPKTKKERLSTDYESLLKLSKKTKHPAVQLAIEISSLRTRSQMLHISCDKDGRVRVGYNVVGSETGRITCYTSPTGSGYNLQTLPDEDSLKPSGHPLRLGMRDLIIADANCYLGKFDLKGADGWTVGAHLAKLGDRTMLDDLLYGIKPAQVLCWMMRHQSALQPGLDRERIKELCKEVKKEDWDYFAYKQCIWGFCYLMGSRKAAAHVFNLSEGKVEMKESDMDTAKAWLFRRYNVRLWWSWMESHLKKQPYPATLVSASGHVRKFFNRLSDALGEALAHEPQSNTTYATNSAARNLWLDPENRYYVGERCLLRVKPMHQVHDELLVQWKIEDTDWATRKIKQWFDNKLVIAGQEIVIPFEGSYGTNWAMNAQSKKGSI